MIKFLEVKRAYYADPENVVVEYNSRMLNRWQKCAGEPLWCEEEDYRIRPRTIRIGDIDVPEGFVVVPVELLDRFPELNEFNYSHDDVCELNAWGIDLVLSAAPEGKK